MTTLGQALEWAAERHRDRTAVISDEETLTYGEWAVRVARCAKWLSEIGVESGERFGILAQQHHYVSELLYAGYRAGSIPVPVNIRLAPREIVEILRDAGCRHVIVDTALLGGVGALAPDLDEARFFALDLAGPAPWAGLEPAPLTQRDPSAEALLLYTGGTSGRGKGVRLSHSNVLTGFQQIALALGAEANDVYLHVAPHFHSADFGGQSFFLVGAAHVFLGSFSVGNVLELVEKRRVTATLLPSTMLAMVLSDPETDRRDLSSLRVLLYGASPLAAPWIRKACERFPTTRIFQGYGLTESAMLLTMLSDRAHRDAVSGVRPDLIAACGTANLGVEVRIVDDEGREAPAGRAGEIVGRGANIMMGYLNRPNDTHRTLRDGWLYTGDLGRMDEQGYLFVLDRKKDMVITGGENVYSAEVETVLAAHPDVREVAVIGVPDAVMGEALLAVVVPATEKKPTVDDVIAFCRGKIGGYKIPRRLEIVERLPRSAMGKVLKNELRAIYAGDRPPSG